MQGFIRFVGGPKHNQHIAVIWKPWIEFPVVTPSDQWLMIQSGNPFLPDRFRTITYKLVALHFGRHTQYFEYHFSGKH